MDVLVERAPAAETYELRQKVLRPHQTVEEMVTPSDEDPGTAYYVARDAQSGGVVSTASVRREAAPWQPEAAGKPASRHWPGPPLEVPAEAVRAAEESGAGGGGGIGAEAGGAGAGRTWRLRGMATAEGVRGQGVGARVLEAVVGHVAAAGGGLLWCSARIPAAAFYERGGFSRLGPEFEEPPIGPHVLMWRAVDPAKREEA